MCPRRLQRATLLTFPSVNGTKIVRATQVERTSVINADWKERGTGLDQHSRGRKNFHRQTHVLQQLEDRTSDANCYIVKRRVSR